MTKKMTDMAAVWAWVQEPEIARLIARTCKRVAWASHVDCEELTSATTLRIGLDGHKFDPKKGSAKTWIHWQARREAKALKRMVKGDREVSYHVGMYIWHGWGGPSSPYSAGGDLFSHPDQLIPAPGAEEQIEARAELALALSNMPEHVQEAAFAKLAGLSNDEVEERWGITSKALYRRISRWRGEAGIGG